MAPRGSSIDIASGADHAGIPDSLENRAAIIHLRLNDSSRTPAQRAQFAAVTLEHVLTVLVANEELDHEVRLLANGL